MANVSRIKETHDAMMRQARIDEKNLRKGLTEAGIHLFREAQAIVPVGETGFLRASGDMRPVMFMGMFAIEISYSASYALFMHEDLDAAPGQVFNEKYKDVIERNPGHKYWFNRGVNQQAKFLEMPLQRDRKKLVGLVARRIESGRRS